MRRDFHPRCCCSWQLHRTRRASGPTAAGFGRRRLQCTLGKAVAVTKAVEAASGGSSRVPRTSSTPVDAWSWPTLLVESETCFGCRVRLVGVSISFEKNLYRLSFTPPSGRQFGPSDSTQQKRAHQNQICARKTTDGPTKIVFELSE
jgi:hypothetical protein